MREERISLSQPENLQIQPAAGEEILMLGVGADGGGRTLVWMLIAFRFFFCINPGATRGLETLGDYERNMAREHLVGVTIFNHALCSAPL